CRAGAAGSARLPPRLRRWVPAGTTGTRPAREPVRELRRPTMTAPKPIILAAYFPGVNNTTVWTDPESKSQIEFESFAYLAQTAERGKLDFFFLAEGLRLREQRGRIHDLDTDGRPDTLAVLAALAGITTHLGLAGTLDATFG